MNFTRYIYRGYCPVLLKVRDFLLPKFNLGGRKCVLQTGSKSLSGGGHIKYVPYRSKYVPYRSEQGICPANANRLGVPKAPKHQKI